MALYTYFHKEHVIFSNGSINIYVYDKNFEYFMIPASFGGEEAEHIFH